MQLIVVPFLIAHLCNIVQSVTTITRVWNDDFVYGVNHWISSTGSSNIVTDGNGNRYHGPYENNNEMNITRSFECTSFSYINISFASLTCGTDRSNYIDIAVNDQVMALVRGDSNTQPFLDPSLECLDATLVTIFSGTHGPFTGPNVPSLTTFAITFHKSITNRRDFWVWRNIKIICEQIPTASPTSSPSKFPTLPPVPTISPTRFPSQSPSFPTTLPPTQSPTPRTFDPTASPTLPSTSPTISPTKNPTGQTLAPTRNPSVSPTVSTTSPSFSPTLPSQSPTMTPSQSPTAQTLNPTTNPTVSPTNNPTISSTSPTNSPSNGPTNTPTNVPTNGDEDQFVSINDSSNGLSATATMIILFIIIACMIYGVITVIRRRFASSGEANVENNVESSDEAEAKEEKQQTDVNENEQTPPSSKQDSMKSSDARAASDIFVFEVAEKYTNEELAVLS